LFKSLHLAFCRLCLCIFCTNFMSLLLCVCVYVCGLSSHTAETHTHEIETLEKCAKNFSGQERRRSFSKNTAASSL
jgi:hypothetical protein